MSAFKAKINRLQVVKSSTFQQAPLEGGKSSKRGGGELETQVAQLDAAYAWTLAAARKCESEKVLLKQSLEAPVRRESLQIEGKPWRLSQQQQARPAPPRQPRMSARALPPPAVEGEMPAAPGGIGSPCETKVVQLTAKLAEAEAKLNILKNVEAIATEYKNRIEQKVAEFIAKGAVDERVLSEYKEAAARGLTTLRNVQVQLEEAKQMGSRCTELLVAEAKSKEEAVRAVRAQFMGEAKQAISTIRQQLEAKARVPVVAPVISDEEGVPTVIAPWRKSTTITAVAPKSTIIAPARKSTVTFSKKSTIIAPSPKPTITSSEGVTRKISYGQMASLTAQQRTPPSTLAPRKISYGQMASAVASTRTPPKITSQLQQEVADQVELDLLRRDIPIKREELKAATGISRNATIRAATDLAKAESRAAELSVKTETDDERIIRLNAEGQKYQRLFREKEALERKRIEELAAAEGEVRHAQQNVLFKGEELMRLSSGENTTQPGSEGATAPALSPIRTAAEIARRDVANQVELDLLRRDIPIKREEVKAAARISRAATMRASVALTQAELRAKQLSMQMKEDKESDAKQIERPILVQKATRELEEAKDRLRKARSKLSSVSQEGVRSSRGGSRSPTKTGPWRSSPVRRPPAK